MQKTKSELTATLEPAQEFHQFTFAPLRESSTNDFTGGLDAYLERYNYHLLPSTSELVQTYESLSAGARFLVVIHWQHMTLCTLVPDVQSYKVFAREYLTSASIAPCLFFPDRANVQMVDNLVYAPFPPKVRF